MVFDSPHASWHPALMPNSASELDQLSPEQPKHEDAPSSAPEPVEPLPKPAELAAPEESTSTSSLQDPKDSFDHGAADDAWFPEYEAGGEHPPAEKEVAPSQTNEANSTHEPEARQEHPVGEQPPAEEQTLVEEQEPQAASNASKHLSNMSFARTVSHEFNWNDDEDAEFNLPKNEPDPFK